MEIYSLSFFLLVSVGLILYYTVFSRCQWICLLGLSLLFFTASGWKGLVFLLFTALTIWLGGLQLAKLDADSAARRKAPGITKDEKKAIKAQAVRCKKCLVAAVLTANFLVLGYFKYWSYFAELLSGAFSATAPSSLGLVMPLGISFYTFQAVGYLIDCYRGRHPAEKNYVRFLLFISFFPQLIQGPINRYGEMAPQLTARHIWNWERTKRALFLFLFGAMKKYAIANLTAPTIAAILDGNDPKLAGSMALLAILLYSLQQYADFSGGIDMVLGVAQLYGIEMMPNFRQPYFSTSLGDFWRRWHISLGAWMRDYLFYPFALTKSMQRFGKWATSHWGKHFGRVLPAAVANLLVFAVVGIWHARRHTTLPGVCITVLSLRWLTCWSPLSKSSTRRCTFLPKAAAGTFFASCGPLSSSTSAGTLTAMSLCRGASTCATLLRISICPHWPRMHPALSRQSPARPGGLSSSVPFWSLPIVC